KEKIPVFSRHTTVFVPMRVSDFARPGEAVINLKIEYQACDAEKCFLPTSVQAEARLHIAGTGEEVKEVNQELFQALKVYRNTINVSFFGWDFSFAASNLWLLFFIAVVGGLLLNFTPCVLPLVPIKIMGL